MGLRIHICSRTSERGVQGYRIFSPRPLRGRDPGHIVGRRSRPWERICWLRPGWHSRAMAAEGRFDTPTCAAVPMGLRSADLPRRGDSFSGGLRVRFHVILSRLKWSWATGVVGHWGRGLLGSWTVGVVDGEEGCQSIESDMDHQQKRAEKWQLGFSSEQV